ncbi:conjugal transfer protein TraI, partial [Acinetobacter baumannii]
MLDAQNRGQPVPAPGIATPNPGISAEEQRRLQEIEAARTSKMFAGTESRTISVPGVAPEVAAPPPLPNLTGLGLAPPPA